MNPLSVPLLVMIPWQALPAATVQIHWSTDRTLYNASGPALSAGTAADGDGTLLQLGYYTAATLANPFAGNWVALISATVGDSGVNENGRFNLTSLLTDGSFTSPAVGTPLSIRYYDGLSLATSPYFNAVSDPTGAWNWVAPGDPQTVLNLAITKGTSIHQSGPIDAYLTTIPLAVPEPSTPALMVLCSTGLVWRRRR